MKTSKPNSRRKNDQTSSRVISESCAQLKEAEREVRELYGVLYDRSPSRLRVIIVSSASFTAYVSASALPSHIEADGDTAMSAVAALKTMLRKRIYTRMSDLQNALEDHE